jgi:hypothetical protein
MICERTLSFGPILALSLLSGVARSANESAPGPPLSTEGIVDGIKLRPVIEITDDTTAIWRRSRTDTATGIRFIKPSIPRPDGVTAPAPALATDFGTSIQSVERGRQQHTAVSDYEPVNPLRAKMRAAVGITPAPVPANVSGGGTCKARPPGTDRQLAGATAAKLRQLIELPKPHAVAAVQTRNQPADCDGTIATCANNAPTQFLGPHQEFDTDEPSHIADKQVVQAAASAPRQLWAAGNRLLQGIGNLLPKTGSRSSVAR